MVAVWLRTYRGRRSLGLAAAFCAVLLSACDSSDTSSPPETSSPPNTPIAQSAPADKKPAGAPRPAQRSGLPLGAGFDFYVLSLSWSPSYCEAEGTGANRQQCASGRPYAFVVHGLWPQYERGFPDDCTTDQPDVPDALVRTLYDIMPAAGLIRYEWRKHGSCTGLDQADYFATLRKAREAVAIPPEFERLADYRSVVPADVERSFLQSNPGMAASGVAVTCDERYLREVRICLTRQLAFRVCPEVDTRACKLRNAVMPPIRGG